MNYLILYYICAGIILLVQALVLLEGYRHLIYTWRNYTYRPRRYQPKTALICPCKGLDTTFDDNIRSLFEQDYPDYEIFFVVESAADPAYERLNQIISRQAQSSGGSRSARVFIAGLSQTSSQKVHNQRQICAAIPAEFKVLAFVDSDACLKSHFLANLVHPLRRSDVGASTGYRWFVPNDRRLSSITLSAINAFFAAALGPHPWNSVWGGAMAMRRVVFDKLDIQQVWRNVCTDDYPLSWAVKEAGLRIIFVPACLVASYEQMSWKELFSFATRQFILTRVYMPRLWWLAVLGFGQFIAGFWGGLIVSLYLWSAGSAQTIYAAILPAVVLASALLKAAVRQMMIFRILPEDRRRLALPAVIDFFFQPFLTLFTLVCLWYAGFTRAINWRGIRYVLHNVDHMEIIHHQN